MMQYTKPGVISEQEALEAHQRITDLMETAVNRLEGIRGYQ